MKIAQQACLIAFSISTALQACAQGYIVPNGVTYLGFDGLGYVTQVRQNPANSDYTGFVLVPQGDSTTFLFGSFTDEGVRVFLVSPNDPMSLQPILAQSYTELGSAPSLVFASGSPFYLGFYTGYNPWDPQGHYTGIYTDPVFGWGEFVNNGGVIEMLSSALEYGGGGIYVGTQDILPVPEPSILGVFALGALAISRCCLRRRG